MIMFEYWVQEERECRDAIAQSKLLIAGELKRLHMLRQHQAEAARRIALTGKPYPIPGEPEVSVRRYAPSGFICKDCVKDFDECTC